MEARGKQAAEFFSQIRNQAIALFAVFTAGRGIKDFVRDITAGDAAAGRLANNIGISTQALSAWQGAAERAGGSASATGGSLYGLSQQFQTFALTGQSSVIPYFRALGVAFSDAQGKMRPMDDILLDLSDKFSKMSAQRAQSMGAGLGLDQGTIQLLMQGRTAVQQLLAEQRRLGVATDEDARRAQQLDNKLRDLKQAVTSVARSILNELTPYITDLLGEFDKWLQTTDAMGKTNREWLSEQVVNAIKDFATWIKSIDWASIKSGAIGFKDAVMGIVDAVGGVTRAIEILFALWLGSKFLRVLGAIGLFGGTLRNAVGGQGARGGGGPNGRGGGIGLGTLLGLAGGLFGVAATASQGIDVNEREQHDRSLNTWLEGTWFGRAARAVGITSGTNIDGTPVPGQRSPASRFFGGLFGSGSANAATPGNGRGGPAFAVGDSIAAGIQQANRTDGGGTVGANPAAILAQIQAMGGNSLAGRNVVLSSGVSNNPAMIHMVEQQIAALRARGAANINLMGVGSRFGGANDQLAEIARRTGVNFQGALATGADGVHPSSYNGLGVGFGGSTASGDTSGYKPLLDLIGRSEGTDKGRGYNETLGYGKFTGGNQNLTGMTLREIDQLQSRMLAHPDNNFHSSALGRYQITQTTLRGLMQQEGLTGNEKFDEGMQDRLAIRLIRSRARGTAQQVQNGLSRIWASVPTVETGEGYYAGQRRTPITSAEVQQAIGATNANRPEWAKNLPNVNGGGAGMVGTGDAIRNQDNSQQANIGEIHVHTAATDAPGIARDMAGAVRKQSFTSQVNTGLA